MPDAELHTIELSHGKARLTAPRTSDLGTVPTGDDRQRDHAADGRFANGNKAAAARGARRALTAPLRMARARVREVTTGESPSVADALLSDALAVYGNVRAELGSSSMLVLGPLATFAAEQILAGYYVKRAAEVGLETELGLSLLAMAHACETQAGRAMTGALAATKALAGRQPKNPIDHHARAAAAFGRPARSTPKE